MRSGLCVLIAVALLLSGCAPASRNAARDLPPASVVAAADDQVTMNVLELYCQSCVEQIIAGCRGIRGVASVEVDRRAKLLTLHFDPGVTSRDRVVAAVDDVLASIP